MAHLLVTTLAIINPGHGKPPPGSGKGTLILSWVAWCVFALCVAGVLVSAAKLAQSHSQGYGGGNQHVSSLLWTMAGCVVAGSAAGIVGALS